MLNHSYITKSITISLVKNTNPHFSIKQSSYSPVPHSHILQGRTIITQPLIYITDWQLITTIHHTLKITNLISEHQLRPYVAEEICFSKLSALARPVIVSSGLLLRIGCFKWINLLMCNRARSCHLSIVTHFFVFRINEYSKTWSKTVISPYCYYYHFFNIYFVANIKCLCTITS